MQRTCGQQSGPQSTVLASRPGNSHQVSRMPISTRSAAGSSRPASAPRRPALTGSHTRCPRNVSAAVSSKTFLQDIKRAVPKAKAPTPTPTGATQKYDVMITYYDPWADLNALDCDWSITYLVDSKTGDHAPQDTVSEYLDKDHGKYNGLDLDVRHTKVSVPEGFQPGAVVVEAKDGFLVKGRHAYIHKITLKPEGGGAELVFPANTYISASQGERVIFTGTPYLKPETPKGLAKLRDDELTALKGGPPSMRKGNERTYQYDIYNDLGGDPSNPFAARPPLGGSTEYPYPRRLRTGRPLYAGNTPPTETAGGVPWLPADDAFADQKVINFLSSAVAALIPTIINGLINTVLRKNGTVFTDIKSVLSLYYDTPDDAKPGKDAPNLSAAIEDLVEDVLRGNLVGLLLPDFKEGNILERLRDLLKQVTGFALPLVLQDSLEQWETDEELGRELLAGQNPLTLVALTSAADLEALTKAGSNIPASEADFKNLLEGKSLSKLLGLSKPRLFVVDHSEVNEDYLERVNNNAVGGTTTLHAARGLFYLRDTGYLVPVAIELKSAKDQPYTVFTPNSPQSVWRLAKAVFASVDSVMHQLVSHWLRTHCCAEPYLIATRRSLSVMHPVFKLIMPHFRYTLSINGAARALLINKEGVIESSFSTGRYSMEVSSKAYGADWRFDEQGLPADLKKRGLMTTDGELLLDDYPYAQDGLLIWDALDKYFGDYLGLYYKSDADVAGDTELQAWWEDIKGPSGGHADKANSPGWPPLNSISNLKFVLATIAWTTSAHHAAVNFDQYDYSGFMPNRSSSVVKAMPLPGSPEYKKLAALEEGSAAFQAELLSYLSPLQTTLTVMTTLKLLSNHSEEEQYLSSDADLLGWLTDDKARATHGAFLQSLQAATQEIDRRNNSGEFKTRSKGDAGIPYTLMLPSSDPGVTGRGVPYSISI